MNASGQFGPIYSFAWVAKVRGPRATHAKYCWLSVFLLMPSRLFFTHSMRARSHSGIPASAMGAGNDFQRALPLQVIVYGVLYQ